MLLSHLKPCGWRFHKIYFNDHRSDSGNTKKIGEKHCFYPILYPKKSPIHSIPLPSETRWYSYFKTLYAVKELKDIIIEFSHIQRKVTLDFDDNLWENVNCLFEIYDTLRIAFQALESNNYGTKSLVLSAFRMVQRIIMEKDPEKWGFLQEAYKESMQRHWDDYFIRNRIELLVASRLNPSTMFITLSNEEIFDTDRYLLAEVTRSSSIFNHQPNVSPNIWRVNGTPATAEQDELVSYINSTIGINTSPINFDLWNFWHQNKSRWPTLHKIAMKIFHIPASSASSERQFSKAKRIIGCLRLAMSPQKLEDQVIVASNSSIAEEIINKRINI